VKMLTNVNSSLLYLKLTPSSLDKLLSTSTYCSFHFWWTTLLLQKATAASLHLCN